MLSVLHSNKDISAQIIDNVMLLITEVLSSLENGGWINVELLSGMKIDGEAH